MTNEPSETTFVDSASPSSTTAASSGSWLAENAEAIAAYNARVESEGLALEEFRRF